MKDWKNQFDKRFGPENYSYIDGNAHFGELDGLWADVKDFIESLLKERVEIEMLVLKAHLDNQIYQPTVTTESIYGYIEDRLAHLNDTTSHE